MTFLFWLCWVFDLLAAIFLLWAVGFRSGFGASTGMQQGLLLVLIVVLISGLILRFGERPRWISLGIVLLPIACLIIGWLFSKISGDNQ